MTDIDFSDLKAQLTVEANAYRDNIALDMMTALVTADWYDRMSPADVANHAYRLADAYLAKREQEHKR